MKRIFTTLAILFATIATVHAQESDDRTIAFGQNKQNQITLEEDKINLKIAGKELSLSSNDKAVKVLKYGDSSYGSISSLGVIELGLNTLAMADEYADGGFQTGDDANIGYCGGVVGYNDSIIEKNTAFTRCRKYEREYAK